MEKKYVKTNGRVLSDSITQGKIYEVIGKTPNGCNIVIGDAGNEIWLADVGKSCAFIQSGTWEYCKPELTFVRPIMTTEARDILDSIHETVSAETRSDSIVKFMEKHTEIGAELCSAKLGWSRELTRANNNDRLLTESRKQEANVRCQNALLKKKAQEYKVWTCVSILTAIAALVALTLGAK